MTEVTPAPAPAAPAATTPPVPPPAAPEAPPWGENFDAEKAWNLVQNLRADKDRLSQRPVLTPEQQQKLDEYTRLEEASKSDAQRLQEAATTAQKDADTARSQALRLQVALDHGIGKDDLVMLQGSTAEELAQAAQWIAAKNAAAGAAPPVVPPVPGQRPIEQLRPGATPTATQTEDDANYARLFGTETR